MPSPPRSITCCSGSSNGSSNCRRHRHRRVHPARRQDSRSGGWQRNMLPRTLTLTDFRDRYLDTHRASLEQRTIEGIELHFKHLLGALGERFPIRELKLADLQGYVDTGAKAKGMDGRRLSAATIKKEIVSLRTAWNWGVKMGLVSGRFPNDGLRFPKIDEKPPFMTREEIERQIAAGGLKPYQIKELWDALFLTLPEIEELLAHVRECGTLPVGLPDGVLRRQPPVLVGWPKRRGGEPRSRCEAKESALDSHCAPSRLPEDDEPGRTQWESK